MDKNTIGVFLLIVATVGIFILGYSMGHFEGTAAMKYYDPCQCPNATNTSQDVRTQIERDIPNWSNMTRFDLAVALQAWSTSHTALGSPNRGDLYEPEVWSGHLADHLAAYRAGRGVYCGGYSQTYCEVLKLFGYPCFNIHAGDYPVFTHTATLVEINDRYYIIDPYFENHFEWNNGTPITWLDMVNMTETNRTDTFHPAIHPSSDDISMTFTEMMTYPLTENHRKQLLGSAPPRALWSYEFLIVDNDGNIATRNMIQRMETLA